VRAARSCSGGCEAADPDVAAVSTPAVLLRGFDYGDTSRIHRFYTRDHGLVSTIARGVRGRSGKGTAAMTTFSSGDLVLWLKPHAELHTLKDFVAERDRRSIPRDVLRFAGASSVAELVLEHAEQEPQPSLFDALEEELDRLDAAPPADLPAAILSALWHVVGAFGFLPQLDACVRCGSELGEEEIGRFDLAAGGVLCARCAHDRAGPRVGPGARRQLEQLVQGILPPDLEHPRRHLALLADFAAHHVVQKPLRTLAFLASRFPPDREPGP